MLSHTVQDLLVLLCGKLVANGGIATFEDVQECMRVTGTVGVMSSEAVLENPAIFCSNRDTDGRHVCQNRLISEYLDLAEKHLDRGEGQ